MELSDQIICELLKKRDKQGLEALYQKYYKALVVWADTFLNNIPASEDLVQEFFISIWEKQSLDHTEPDKLKEYLHTSVRNRALNHLEKHDPLRDVYGIDRIVPIWEEYDSGIDDLIARVMKAVEKLPPRSRDVVKCIYVEGLHYKEAAEKLGISIATLKTLLVNSLKTLRSTFGADVEIFFVYLLKKNEKSIQPFLSFICL